ncbi:unnamed protein product [Tetraodon nigroviridis]|uniref:(spotted green pufferfish) hypothetical protein n=1 Tax=Tetraodon nigroviridis TaxID=99883 RepID=Q4SSF7_TETNG|nr:unnamed protein product [Tetraodon nigroviridis]
MARVYRVQQVQNPMPSLHKLDQTHQQCQEIVEFTAAVLRQVTESYHQSQNNEGVCVTPFIKLWTQFEKKVCPQNWTWEKHLQYKFLYNVLQTQQEGIKTGYKHAQGIDGFPRDLDMAYSYYSNAGAQSRTDSSRLHEKMTAAFQWFLNASRHGHVGATVEVAWYLSTGNLEGVSQDVERAVICVEAEDEQLITPCSVSLLGVQMRKALRRMTQQSAQLILAYAALLSTVVITVTIPLQNCLERAVRQTARTSASTEDGFSWNREQDGTMGGGYGTLRDRWVSILNEAQRLQQTGEVALTLSGVCLCTFWVTLLHQLL